MAGCGHLVSRATRMADLSVRGLRFLPASHATCARLLPNDVRVTVEQQLPGNLSIEDWTIMREIVAAVRQAIPDAAQRPAREVLQHVLVALRQAEAKTIEQTYAENPSADESKR